MILVTEFCKSQNSSSRPGNDQVLDLGSGDIGGPRKIDDLALLLQEIEMPGPVITNHENVDVMLVNVRFLLFPVLFRNDLIDKSEGFEDDLAIRIIARTGLVFFHQIEFVG